jgi:hypothetical protein
MGLLLPGSATAYLSDRSNLHVYKAFAVYPPSLHFELLCLIVFTSVWRLGVISIGTRNIPRGTGLVQKCIAIIYYRFSSLNVFVPGVLCVSLCHGEGEGEVGMGTEGSLQPPRYG